MRLVSARSPKLLWHDTLVAHADTHAWVLSLYRAGELHPETVDDYFPSWAAPTEELARAIDDHAADERRHVKMYDRAIQKLGESRFEATGFDVFNVVIRHETAERFRAERTSPPETRVRALASFLAHAHFLEKRIVRSLEYHLDACLRAGQGSVAAVVAAVHADEVRHAAYTREAVFSLLPRRDAFEVLAVHRAGERRANLAFSARQVKAFLARFADRGGTRRRLLFQASAALMETTHDLLD